MAEKAQTPKPEPKPKPKPKKTRQYMGRTCEIVRTYRDLKTGALVDELSYERVVPHMTEDVAETRPDGSVVTTKRPIRVPVTFAVGRPGTSNPSAPQQRDLSDEELAALEAGE